MSLSEGGRISDCGFRLRSHEHGSDYSLVTDAGGHEVVWQFDSVDIQANQIVLSRECPNGHQSHVAGSIEGRPANFGMVGTKLAEIDTGEA